MPKTVIKARRGKNKKTTIIHPLRAFITVFGI